MTTSGGIQCSPIKFVQALYKTFKKTEFLLVWIFSIELIKALKTQVI